MRCTGSALRYTVPTHLIAAGTATREDPIKLKQAGFNLLPDTVPLLCTIQETSTFLRPGYIHVEYQQTLLLPRCPSKPSHFERSNRRVLNPCSVQPYHAWPMGAEEDIARWAFRFANPSGFASESRNTGSADSASLENQAWASSLVPHHGRSAKCRTDRCEFGVGNPTKRGWLFTQHRQSMLFTPCP